MTVVVACDDAQAGRGLVGRLAAVGVEATLETDASRLADIARRAPPFAVLLRWRTDNLAGILVSRLRTWWPIPVLSLTPDGDGPAVLRALRSGAWDAVEDSAFRSEQAREAMEEGRRIAGGGHERLGPYEIYELLGTGGMGVVHRARDLRGGREVALKILRPEQAVFPDFRARFDREVREAMELRHPGLVAVYEGGQARGRFYLAMELVQGRTLEKILAESAPLPIRRALAIARRLAEALAHAHALGRVHRDIKPDNIVLGAQDDVHIMDFGLLRRTDDVAQITARGEFVGTVRYASPEHMRGERVDARGDLYSLGVVLYEMLSGHRPHEGRDTMRLAREVAFGSPVQPLHEATREVPQELSAFVQRLLALRPEDRPDSAASVIESIDRLMG